MESTVQWLTNHWGEYQIHRPDKGAKTKLLFISLGTNGVQPTVLKSIAFSVLSERRTARWASSMRRASAQLMARSVPLASGSQKWEEGQT